MMMMMMLGEEKRRKNRVAFVLLRELLLMPYWKKSLPADAVAVSFATAQLRRKEIIFREIRLSYARS